MSRAKTTVREHFDKNPYRYLITHLHPNRQQRRAEGRRDPKTKKLIMHRSQNFTYTTSMFGSLNAEGETS